MAELPSASTRIEDQATASGGGDGVVAVIGCVPQSADITPRFFGSTKALLSLHGYSQAVDYSACHMQRAKAPVLFVGLPIATQGAVTHIDQSGVAGSSKITLTPASSGVLEEVIGVARVVNGGTVGIYGIELMISLDGGRNEQIYRLGTATSLQIQYIGLSLAFGAGTLVKGDTFRFRTSAPMWSSSDINAARLALANQMTKVRTFMFIGDVSAIGEAEAALSAANTYASQDDRFVVSRIGLRDAKRASKAKLKNVMSATTLTFAEVGVSGDTIERSSGSWIADGFAVGDTISVSGTASNNLTARIVSVTATQITLGTEDLTPEVTTTASVVGSETLTFAEVGVSGDTIARSSGSWIADGFAVGDTISISGTASNNLQRATIANLSATTITLGTEDLTPETVAGYTVTIETVRDYTVLVTQQNALFGSIDDERRIDISFAKAKRRSPILQYSIRRSPAWSASIEEYASRIADLHQATWKKSKGSLPDWSMETDGVVDEYDERTIGGALNARFTCFRTWGNGPRGTFLALSLTRANEGSLLSRTHNMHVANLVCSTIQAEAENAIGEDLELEDSGKATAASLAIIETRINKSLALALRSRGFGNRASSCVWKADKDSVLNVPGAKLLGVADLRLRGTLEQIDTAVRVPTGGN
jgi:hypothetical protein